MPLIGHTPAAPPAPLTPEQHAELAWPWLKAACAPSTWKAFVASVGVRQPQAKTWSTQSNDAPEG